MLSVLIIFTITEWVLGTDQCTGNAYSDDTAKVCVQCPDDTQPIEGHTACSCSAGRSVIQTLAPSGLPNEEVWEAILYGYKVDAHSPSYISRGDRVFSLFDKENEMDLANDITISSHSEMQMDSQISDSEHVASKKVADSMSVSGHYGAFSAAASMEVSDSSDSSIRTMRIDALITAIKYDVASIGRFRTEPVEYLTKDFKRAVDELSVQQIEERIGVFYARRLELGGKVRKSYTMQVAEEDTQTSVEAELRASCGIALMGVSAEFGLGLSTREKNRNAEVNTKWSASGGDTMVWLSRDLKSDEGIARVKEAWAATFTDKNLYPFNFELGYMWELVKHVNEAKGEEFQRYLEEKWKADAAKFKPTKFAKSANDKCGFIKHSGGKCLHPKMGHEYPSYGTDLVVHHDCEESRLYYCRRELDSGAVEIYHMNSNWCIQPEKDGYSDDQKLKLGQCGLTKNRWKFRYSGSIMMVDSGKCWHPKGGKSNPHDTTNVIVHHDCDEDRLQFTFHETTTIPN